MKDDDNKRVAPVTASGGARQDRLKQALRENLKRRKSQARGRSDGPAGSSAGEGVALDDDGGAGHDR